MRRISQKQLTANVNLVKWEEKKTLQKFNLLTVHSLLLNTNPKFVELKQKVEIFNSTIAKGLHRKHLQYAFTKQLYALLRQMVQLPTYEGQLEMLNNVYDWTKQGTGEAADWDQFSQLSKSRPTTATTRTRPFSAYSRPKSGVAKVNFIKLEEPLTIRNDIKTKKTVDYDKLKPGEIEFYTGARTIHKNEEDPKKRLKEFQRKIFYEDEPDSDLEIIDLHTKQDNFNFKTLNKNPPKQQEPQELPNPDEENQNKEGDQNPLADEEAGPEGQDDANVDDLPIDGQAGQEEPAEVVDKLKPKLKAFIKHQTDLSNNHFDYAKGVNKYVQERYRMVKKNEEDEFLKQKMLEWAKEKSRNKRQQKRRAESARIVTKQVGIGYTKNQPQAQNKNVINLQDIPVFETKPSRPKTAFRAFNESNRKQIIQSCFITSAMGGHIQKFESNGKVEGRQMRITSLAERPKKKTFEEILREADERVKEDEMNEILNVKEKFAKNKVPFESNRIAKSVTYHSMGAQEDEYEYEQFVGDITGLSMVKNPFFKFGKKKKKKGKKKK